MSDPVTAWPPPRLRLLCPAHDRGGRSGGEGSRAIELTTAAAMSEGHDGGISAQPHLQGRPGYHAPVSCAAGGVGLIAGQWAKALGARVIGTAGGADKVALALAHGYDHVIDYRAADFVTELKALTGGKGVDVVYDSVGRDTFPQSLDCLKMRGMWVSFGQSSGPLEPFNLAILAQKGSLFATRPTLFNYIASKTELDLCASALFDVCAKRQSAYQCQPDLQLGRRASGACRSGGQKNERNNTADAVTSRRGSRPADWMRTFRGRAFSPGQCRRLPCGPAAGWRRVRRAAPVPAPAFVSGAPAAC